VDYFLSSQFGKFIETYFEIKLHPYQKIMIWLCKEAIWHTLLQVEPAQKLGGGCV